MPERPATQYTIDALPTFAPVSYKRPEPKEEEHYVRPTIDVTPKAQPRPVPVPKPTNVIANADDDVWGGYLAAWSKPKPATSYEETAKAAGPWKPAPFQPFDVSKYLLRGRETKASTGTKSTGKYWWDAAPAAPAKGGKQPWWDAMTQDMPDDAPAAPEEHYPAPRKPAYKPYVPRSTYTKPYAPALKWQAAPAKGYWWQGQNE